MSTMGGSLTMRPTAPAPASAHWLPPAPPSFFETTTQRLDGCVQTRARVQTQLILVVIFVLNYENCKKSCQDQEEKEMTVRIPKPTPDTRFATCGHPPDPVQVHRAVRHRKRVLETEGKPLGDIERVIKDVA